MFRNILFAAALAAPMAANASTVTLDFGPVSTTDNGPIFVFNLAAPTGITGGAVFTFTANGDLGGAGGSAEYVDIDLDGYSLGRVFDGNEANDPFNFVGDNGALFVNLTGTTIIPQTTMAGLIADNELVLTFDFSPGVDQGTLHLQGSVNYVTSAVPLPASLPLLGGGLLALLGLARRRRA